MKPNISGDWGRVGEILNKDNSAEKKRSKAWTWSGSDRKFYLNCKVLQQLWKVRIPFWGFKCWGVSLWSLKKKCTFLFAQRMRSSLHIRMNECCSQYRIYFDWWDYMHRAEIGLSISFLDKYFSNLSRPYCNFQSSRDYLMITALTCLGTSVIY